MKLIIEQMFDDAQIPSKEHARSSGFDLYVHRFLKIYSNRYMTDAMIFNRYGATEFAPCDQQLCVNFFGWSEKRHCCWFP